MKKSRQQKIIEIISQYNVETQDELIEYLQKENFHVTQATVSRDIRELDLIKITTPQGVYKYTRAHSSERDRKREGGLGNAVVNAVLSVDFAQNIIVLKTSPGMSDAVAVEIDRHSIPGILGCVAGDDTIIIVAADSETARHVGANMRDILSGI